MVFDEKIEQLKKGLQILNQFPENLQQKAFDYLFDCEAEEIKKIVEDKKTFNTTDSQTTQVITNCQDGISNKYARIYTYDGENVYLHKKIPGNNNATKTKNIALIVLYAKGSVIYGDEIKRLCEKQGCLDKSNFSSTFDSDVKNFIKKGKKNSSKWTLELTMDGQDAAESLLEEMLNANK